MVSLRFWEKKKPERESEYPKMMVEGAIRDLEEKAGLYLLNKGGYLESRLAEIHNTLTSAAKVGDIVTYVEEAKRMVLVVASAWLRGMQNPWLAKKVNAYLDNYRVLRGIEGGLPYLAREAEVIVNLSFTNLDVEPPPPIFIQALPMPRRYTPYGYEGEYNPYEGGPPPKQGEGSESSK